MQPENSPDGELNEALLETEREMQRSECPLPEAPVSEFSSPLLPVLYSPHQISLAAARELFLKTFAENAGNALALPKGASAESIVATARPVFVPRWFIAGDIAGKWHATGIDTEAWEVDCPNCFGSGKVGSGSQKRQCESCWGSGKEKQSRKSKHLESGEASAVVREALDNNGCGVVLPLDPSVGADPLPLPDEARARLRCLRPATIYHSAATDILKNRLAAAIEEQAKSALKKYSRIDAFQFEGETIQSQSAVSVWLYPAYLCGFEAKGAKQYLLCDGVTGKVVVAQRQETAPVSQTWSSSQSQTTQAPQAASKAAGHAESAVRSSEPLRSIDAGNASPHASTVQPATAGASASSKLPIVVVILLIIVAAAWYFLKR